MVLGSAHLLPSAAESREHPQRAQTAPGSHQQSTRGTGASLGQRLPLGQTHCCQLDRTTFSIHMEVLVLVLSSVTGTSQDSRHTSCVLHHEQLHSNTNGSAIPKQSSFHSWDRNHSKVGNNHLLKGRLSLFQRCFIASAMLFSTLSLLRREGKG